MKHKADIGCIKIAKHTVEIEPEATPDREGARRMSHKKAPFANQEVRDLSALRMIQLSLSPWASGIVMVKNKNGELHLFEWERVPFGRCNASATFQQVIS